VSSRLDEVPIKVCDLRDEMRVGNTYMTELLRACGLTGKKFVLRSVVLKFLRDNPGWRIPHQGKGDTLPCLLREALDELKKIPGTETWPEADRKKYFELIARIERKLR
jgi:hypothetical protein